MLLEDALAYALVVGIVLIIFFSSVSTYRRHRADREHAATYESPQLEE
jgi:hypothetical protein